MMQSPTQLAYIRKLRTVQRRFFDAEGLQLYGAFGTCITRRIRGGRMTNELCIEVFVDKKRDDVAPEVRLNPRHTFAAGFEDIPIDVCAMERPSRLAVDYDVRLQSAAPETKEYGSGTLGGWAWDVSDESLVIVSNAHVVGHRGDHRIMLDSVTIARGKDGLLDLEMDAAKADPEPGTEFAPDIPGIGPAIFGIDDPEERMQVVKFGSTTHKTEGTVVGVHMPCLDPVNAFRVDDAVQIVRNDSDAAWAEHGDSGALVFRCPEPDSPGDPVAVALLCATFRLKDPPRVYTAAYPIRQVFADLQLETLAVRPFAAFLQALGDGDGSFEFFRSRRAPGYKPPANVSWALDLMASFAEMPALGGIVSVLRSGRAKLLKGLVNDLSFRGALVEALLPLLHGRPDMAELLGRRLMHGAAGLCHVAMQAVEQKLGRRLELREGALGDFTRLLADRSADGQTLGALLATIDDPSEPLPPVPAR